MTEGFIALLVSHNSFALVFAGDFIIAVSHKKISVGEPTSKSDDRLASQNVQVSLRYSEA